MYKKDKKFLLVGGCVRDMIMGREPKDKDYIAIGYTEKELLEIGFEKVGKDFPVFLHPKTKDEYALPRKEISTGNGYKDFKFITENVTLEEDLGRRDLTMNAIAFDEEKNEFIDPYDGINDIKNKIIRHINDEAFMEDPLRILRVFRFNARYIDFKIDKKTFNLCKKNINKIQFLSQERINIEFEKAFSEKNSWKFLKLLMDVNGLHYAYNIDIFSQNNRKKIIKLIKKIRDVEKIKNNLSVNQKFSMLFGTLISEDKRQIKEVGDKLIKQLKLDKNKTNSIKNFATIIYILNNYDKDTDFISEIILSSKIKQIHDEIELVSLFLSLDEIKIKKKLDYLKNINNELQEFIKSNIHKIPKNKINEVKKEFVLRKLKKNNIKPDNKITY